MTRRAILTTKKFYRLKSRCSNIHGFQTKLTGIAPTAKATHCSGVTPHACVKSRVNTLLLQLSAKKQKKEDEKAKRDGEAGEGAHLNNEQYRVNVRSAEVAHVPPTAVHKTEAVNATAVSDMDADMLIAKAMEEEQKHGKKNKDRNANVEFKEVHLRLC